MWPVIFPYFLETRILSVALGYQGKSVPSSSYYIFFLMEKNAGQFHFFLSITSGLIFPVYTGQHADRGVQGNMGKWWRTQVFSSYVLDLSRSEAQNSKLLGGQRMTPEEAQARARIREAKLERKQAREARRANALGEKNLRAYVRALAKRSKRK